MDEGGEGGLVARGEVGGEELGVVHGHGGCHHCRDGRACVEVDRGETGLVLTEDTEDTEGEGTDGKGLDDVCITGTPG